MLPLLRQMQQEDLLRMNLSSNEVPPEIVSQAFDRQSVSHLLRFASLPLPRIPIAQSSSLTNEISAAGLIRLLLKTEREKALQRQLIELLIQQRTFQQHSDSVKLSPATPPARSAERIATPSPTSSSKRDLSTVSVISDSQKPAKKRKIQIPKVSPEPSTPSVKVDEKESDSGTNFKLKDARWVASLERLKQYKEKYGDCIVPRGYSPDPRLASWVAEQRKQYKLYIDGKPSSITPKRILLLEQLDFAWNAQEAAWTRHYESLLEFRKRYGHCHCPLNHSDFPKLGLWVKEQRRHYTLLMHGKASHMTHERVEKLNDIGFCWDTHEAIWLERLRELRKYKEQHGSLLVPTNYPANPKLGTWVHHQRRQYRKFLDGEPCYITQERVKVLEGLGFVWFPRERNSDASSLSDSSSMNDESCHSRSLTSPSDAVSTH